MRPTRTAHRWLCAIVAMIAAVACAGGAQAGDMGANKFDLLLQYTGRASGGDGSPAFLQVTRAMARKAILDAADAGFTFLRVSASGYSPSATTDKGDNDLSLWMKNPAAYWGLVDAMFDDLDRANVRLEPSLIWNPAQFPAVSGESEAAMIGDPASKSRALLKQYIGDFVTRYRSRKTILFYELTNELNLPVDLDLQKRCRTQNPPRTVEQCTVAGNFSTDQMIAFSRDMVGFIKGLDPGHAISSGYGLPRQNARHMALQPEFSPRGADWTADTPAQFAEVLTRTQAPFDIVSVHVYQDAKEPRFGKPPGREDDTIDLVSDAVRAAHKKLFVGEFAGDDAYDTRIAGKLTEGKVDYAAPWIWEFYQFNTHRFFNEGQAVGSLEPGLNDATIATLTAGQPKPLSAGAVGAAPRVVLTWPLPCSSVDVPVDLTAVASGPRGDPIDHVDFLAGDTVLGTSKIPPFHLSFQPFAVTAPSVVLAARAVTHAGLTASFQSKVRVNRSAEPCVLDTR